MADIRQSDVRNRLLRALAPGDFALLAPHLRLEGTRLREPMSQPGEPAEECQFVESGIVSVATPRGGSRIEIGVIGREGLVGAAAVLLGDGRSPHDHFVQMSGEVLRVPTPVLAQAAEASPTLRRLLLGYVYTHLVQVAQTAHANGSLGLEGRLARWLLMCHDRVDGDDLFLTHEFLSIMLGVQRPGVTLALQNLEGAGRIRGRRRRITVLDREQLRASTDGCYGVAEAEYARLIEGR